MGARYCSLLIPCFFASFSNSSSRIYTNQCFSKVSHILNILLIPHTFTAFSNRLRKPERTNTVWALYCSHHSQTHTSSLSGSKTFNYHILLHHSQTKQNRREFKYHILLHHSQTCVNKFLHIYPFKYHILLHHSQT